MTYFNRNRSSLELYGPKLHDLQLDLRVSKDVLENPDTKTTNTMKITKKIEKIEKKIADIQATIARLEFLAANPDELVKEYLLTLPANRKTIDLCDMFGRHSLTVVPDLS